LLKLTLKGFGKEFMVSTLTGSFLYLCHITGSLYCSHVVYLMTPSVAETVQHWTVDD